MPQVNWPPPHSDALRDFLAKGMSFAEAAGAVNAMFDTSYTRNAALGRAKRMGLASSHRPAEAQKAPQQMKIPPLPERRESREPAAVREVNPFGPAEGINLRCIEIVPRHLTLIELEAGDCRYPYGGDAENETITFCGHPRRDNSSYCAGHLDLSRGPGTASERAAVAICLWLLQAA
jgi:GcrA cell cycle regulator